MKQQIQDFLYSDSEKNTKLSFDKFKSLLKEYGEANSNSSNLNDFKLKSVYDRVMSVKQLTIAEFDSLLGGQEYANKMLGRDMSRILKILNDSYESIADTMINKVLEGIDVKKIVESADIKGFQVGHSVKIVSGKFKDKEGKVSNLLQPYGRIIVDIDGRGESFIPKELTHTPISDL